MKHHEIVVPRVHSSSNKLLEAGSVERTLTTKKMERAVTIQRMEFGPSTRRLFILEMCAL